MQKDEIKEILDKLKKLCYDDYCLEFSVDYIERKEEKLLLDYITNLQEENKILKENAEHNDKVVDKAKWNEMIYKSRNEKAIEYMNNTFDITSIKEFYEHLDNIENILQGEKRK